MNQDQEEKKSQQITDFRYSIIAELLNPYLTRAERRRLMHEKAGRRYEIPYSGRTRLGYDCIRKWYAAFQRFGKEGLRPKTRSDRGVCRALSAEESAALLEYLEGNPELTAKAAYRKLREQGTVRTELSKSALSRLVVAAGLRREDRLREKDQRQQLTVRLPLPPGVRAGGHDVRLRAHPMNRVSASGRFC